MPDVKIVWTYLCFGIYWGSLMQALDTHINVTAVKSSIQGLRG